MSIHFVRGPIVAGIVAFFAAVNVHLLCYSSPVPEALALPQAQPSAATTYVVQKEHPRLLLVDDAASRVAAAPTLWKEVIRIADSDPGTESAAQDRCLCAAAIVRIGTIKGFKYGRSKNQYRANAISDLMRMSTVSGANKLGHMQPLAIGYDWLYPELTESQRTLIRNRIVEMLKLPPNWMWEAATLDSGLGMISALAIHGETKTDWVAKYWKENWWSTDELYNREYERNWQQGGGTRDSWPSLADQSLLVTARAAWETATGDRTSLAYPWFENVPLLLMHQSHIAGRRMFSLPAFRFGGVYWGDPGIGQWLAAGTGSRNPDIAALSAWLLSQAPFKTASASQGLIYGCLIGDPRVKAKSPQQLSLPLDYTTAGSGYHYDRTNWTATATRVYFGAQETLTRAFPIGDVMIWIGDKPLLGSRDALFFGHQAEYPMRNVMLLYEKRRPIDPARGDGVARRLRVVNTKLVGKAWRADLTGLYSEYANSMTREFSFDRATQTVTVTDDVSCRTGIVPRMSWNTPEKPVVTGDKITLTTGSVKREMTFDVKPAEIIVRGGEKSVLWAQRYDGTIDPSALLDTLDWGGLSRPEKVRAGGFYTIYVTPPLKQGRYHLKTTIAVPGMKPSPTPTPDPDPTPPPKPIPAPPDNPGPPGNYTVESGHPRIYWHDDIAARVSAAPEVMERVLDFAESDSTLTHVVIGRALCCAAIHRMGLLPKFKYKFTRSQYVERGIKSLLQMCEEPINLAGTHYAINHLHPVAIGYDWFYDVLTEEQRSLIRNRLVEALTASYGKKFDLLWTGYNHDSGAGMTVALAIHGETDIDWVSRYWRENWWSSPPASANGRGGLWNRQYERDWLAGGGGHEDWGYLGNQVSIAAARHAWETATGDTQSLDYPFLTRNSQLYLHQTQAIPVFDAKGVASSYKLWRMQSCCSGGGWEAQGAAFWFAAGTGSRDATTAALSAWLLSKYAYGGQSAFEEFFWRCVVGDPRVQPKSPAELGLPLDYTTASTRFHYDRTDWSEDATRVFFGCSEQLYRATAVGDVMIWSRGLPLIAHRNATYDHSYSGNGRLTLPQIREVATGKLIPALGGDGTPIRRKVASLTRNGDVYTADLSQLFAGTASRYLRTFAFDRATKTVTITDEAECAPGYVPCATWGTPERPVLTDGWIKFTNGEATADMTFDATPAEVTLRGGEVDDLWAEDYDRSLYKVDTTDTWRKLSRPDQILWGGYYTVYVTPRKVGNTYRLTTTITVR